jgi:NADH dehydrogenase
MGVLPRVVIVGAGFGGLEVARGLARAPVEVIVVDRNNFHTFQPLLYQVATAGLNDADVAYAVRGLFHKQHNVDVRVGEVTGVDWAARSLTIADEPPLEFDHLVVGVGASVSFFGVAGADECAFPLYTLPDAVLLRNHILERFEAAAADPSLIDQGVLTFVVVGGGPTGVETAGALAELFAQVLRKDYPRVDVSRARVILVELDRRLLPPFTPASGKHALDVLTRMHVEVRTREQVERITPTSVSLASGEVIATCTLVWAAGVRANPLADVLGLEQGPGGRIVVGPDLRAPGQRDVWVVGDIALARDRKGDPLPQLAPVAMQGGRHIARQIKRALDGAPTKPFRYRNKGTMATIGRRAAVAELPGGIRLQGTLGWMAWLALHIYYLVGKRNRVSVLLNWMWMYLTWDRGPRLILRVGERDSVSRHG